MFGQLVSFGDGTLLSGIHARDGSVFRLSVREPATVLSKSPATFRLANGSSVVPVAGGTLVELPSTAADAAWVLDCLSKRRWCVWMKTHSLTSLFTI